VGPEDIARVRALADRQLTTEEWQAYVNQPMTADEREEIDALLEWFARRYPTPAARLAYARRAYRRWTRK
jgi:hypothetical protein